MALDFDGTDDRIDWANVFTTSGQALTISVWAWFDVLNPAANQYLFNGSLAAGGGGTIFYQGSGVNGNLAFTRIAASVHKDRITSANVITTGSWTHCLLTDDGSLTAANAKIYVAGSEVTYATTTNGIAPETAATGVWSLGGRASDNLRNFNGRLANVGVWNRVVTADEIAILAAGYNPQFIMNGLRFCAPIFGRSTEINLLGAAASTTVGTAAISHPRTIMPSIPNFARDAVAVLADGNTVAMIPWYQWGVLLEEDGM